MSATTGMLTIILTAFSFHVVMLGIEVILSLYILGMVYLSNKNNDKELLSEAHLFMNYIIMTYASAHFFLTATTVFVLSFFPDFLVLAGRILFYPLLWVFFMLLLRLAMVSWTWYGWNKWVGTWVHTTVLSLFALAGVLWVYFYTTLLGFMNYTYGLVSISPLVVESGKLFVNPTIWTLLITIVSGALAVTSFMLLFMYSIKLKEGGKDKKELYEKLMPFFLKIGYFAFIVFVPFLLAYVFTLKKYSPYKYSNMVGFVLGQTAQGVSYGWMFLLVVILAVIVLAISTRVFLVYNKNPLDQSIRCRNMSLTLGPLSAVVFLIVFLLNLLSQNPYFVVAPEAASSLPAIIVDTSFNSNADVIDVYSLTIFGFTPLLLAFFSLLYFIFSGRLVGDGQVKGKIAAEL